MITHTHTHTQTECKLAAFAKAARHARSASRGHISHYRCRSALRLHLKCWQIKRFLILMYFFIIFSCFLFCKFVFFFQFSVLYFFIFLPFFAGFHFFHILFEGFFFAFVIYIYYMYFVVVVAVVFIVCSCVLENHCAAIENNLICKLL